MLGGRHQAQAPPWSFPPTALGRMGWGRASVPPPSPHGPVTLLPRPVPWHWVAPEWTQPLLLFAGKSSGEVAGPPVGLPDWAARWPLPQTPPPARPHFLLLSCPLLYLEKNVL